MIGEIQAFDCFPTKKETDLNPQKQCNAGKLYLTTKEERGKKLGEFWGKGIDKNIGENQFGTNFVLSH